MFVAYSISQLETAVRNDAREILIAGKLVASIHEAVPITDSIIGTLIKRYEITSSESGSRDTLLLTRNKKTLKKLADETDH